MDSLFVKSILIDKVKVKPRFINKNIQQLLLTTLQKKFEGKCSQHGYIKTDSISILRYSMGNVMAVSLNGDVIYTVQFAAKVCNPSIDTVVSARVVNTNKFGILAEYSSSDKVPILEIIIAKNTIEDHHKLKEIDALKPNDVVRIKVVGKKFELGDKKISVVGTIVFDEEDVTKQEKNHDASDDEQEDNDVDIDINDEEEENDEDGNVDDDVDDNQKEDEEVEIENEGVEEEEDDEDEDELFSDNDSEFFSDNDSEVASSHGDEL